MQTTKIILGLAIFTLSTFHSFGQKQIKKIVFFEPNQFAVSTSNKLILDSLVTKIKDKVYQITLIGHADSIGGEMLNLKLSKKRTINVATYLQLKGFDTTKITSKYLGEANPIFSNSITNERVKNRCVEIIVIYKKEQEQPQITQTTESKPSIVEKPKFENDTILRFKNGTQIEITSETFYPRKIKDINFNVTEIYTLCDMLNNNVMTRATNGDCLTSAGMVFVKPTIAGVEVQPNIGMLVKIRIPTNGGVLDKSMKLYGGVKDENNKMIWKDLTPEVSYEEYGNQFYVFKVDTLSTFNLDKPMGIICKKDGPKIKIPKLKDAVICQTYPNEKFLAIAEKVNKRKFVLDKFVDSKKPQITVVAYDKSGNPYVATGPLLELKYIKWRNMYVVKKKYFKRILKDFSKPMTPNDYLCNYLDV
jgi:hypothetical protein